MNNMMQFEGVAAILALLALLIFFIGFKFLASAGWIMGWLRGNFGMALALIAGGVVLFLLDIRTYLPMHDDKAIATINFDQISPNNYQMRLVDVNGIESRFSLTGDRWYVSINQFKWSTRFAGMGLGHGYRFSSVGGISTATGNTQSSDIAIAKSGYIDSWRWVRSYMPSNFFITAVFIKPDAVPMIAGAIYEVVPSGAAIFIKPVNDVAIKAGQAISPVSATPPVVEPAIIDQPLPAEQSSGEVPADQPAK